MQKVGCIPDPCKVPLLNLKTRELKIIDFSSSAEEIEWDLDEGLFCVLPRKEQKEEQKEKKTEEQEEKRDIQEHAENSAMEQSEAEKIVEVAS